MNDSDRDPERHFDSDSGFVEGPDASTDLGPDAGTDRTAGSPMERRRFLRLIAAGGAAAAAAGLAGSAAAQTPAAKARPPRAARKPIPPAVERELASQRKTIADMLKVIRDHELPSGSDPAASFRAIRSAKARREGF
ncbi:MAG TPA: hypothetical protein VFM17_08280 [Candidatus Eisenbacteria bacterium]|jgi:hypothetical protein|nr:hypothetical protein [Candidatus Eisenbacteria bacterium]